MNSYNVGDLVIIKSITAWATLRDEDEGKIGVVIATYYDWALRTDILYIQIDNKRKGFYLHEVELLC